MTEISDDSGNWACGCGSGGPRPCSFRTVQALKAGLGNACRLLDGGLEIVDMLVPELLNPIAVTAGSGSLLTDQGRFAPIQFAGMRFSCNPKEITLRSSQPELAGRGKCLVAISEVESENRQPPAIHVFSEAGQIVHRIHLSHPDDELILHAVGTAARTWKGSIAFLAEENGAQDPSQGVISLAPYLTARDRWTTMTLANHLDQIIADGGPSRLRTLQQVKDRTAWQIETQVLWPFLHHLARIGHEFTRIVPQPTLLQASAGSLDGFRNQDGLLFLSAGASTTVVDLSAVHQCWAVTYHTGYNPLLAIEIYDAANRCLAAFLVDQQASHEVRVSWHRLVCSLPRL